MLLEQRIKSGKLIGSMSFNQKVWALCARVPKGQVTTYGEIARALGTKAYRAVGNALNKNPYAPDVPCHRVVGTGGSLAGFASGIDHKKKLLLAEGISIRGDRVDVSQIFRLGKSQRQGRLFI